MDRSLLIHLPSQSVDCVRQASCIQELKSRKNQAEWHRSPDSYNHQWKKLWASWQFQRCCYLINHQTSREQLEELQMFSSGEYHKFWVYKTISRPGVDKSSEQNFIKVILTKNQRRSNVTNFIQLVSPQPVCWFSQTKLCWKAPNEGYPHICGIYKSNNKWLRYQAISSCKSFVC